MDVNENGQQSRNNGTLEYLNIEAGKDSLGSLFQHSLIDDLVKSRHSRAGGNPESMSQLKKLDSRFHGNDTKTNFRAFCDFIIIPSLRSFVS
jgi:hypothetical protein